MNFIITDQQDYKVEGYFNADDFVLPLNSQIQSMNSLIKLSQSKKWKEMQQRKKNENNNIKPVKTQKGHVSDTNNHLAIPRISSNLHNIGSIQNIGSHPSTTPVRGGKSEDYLNKITRKYNEVSEDKKNEQPNNYQPANDAKEATK